MLFQLDDGGIYIIEFKFIDNTEFIESITKYTSSKNVVFAINELFLILNYNIKTMSHDRILVRTNGTNLNYYF